MNKTDKNLVLIITSISLILILIMILTEEKTNKIAIVYYEDKIVEEIDLSILTKQEFDIKGYNGSVKVIALDGKIKVDEENSPLHLCSKQGYISKSYETIVCLPNKIIIKIEDSNQIDTIAK